jgi:hypothetical protein
MGALTPEQYAKMFEDMGLSYGVACVHKGMLNEGAIFMFLGPAEPPWAWVLVLRGDLNNFYEGQLAKAHSGLDVYDPLNDKNWAWASVMP